MLCTERGRGDLGRGDLGRGDQPRGVRSSRRQGDVCDVPHERCGHVRGESQPGREAGLAPDPPVPAWMCAGRGSGWEPGRRGTHRACSPGARGLPREMTGRGQWRRRRGVLGAALRTRSCHGGVQSPAASWRRRAHRGRRSGREDAAADKNAQAAAQKGSNAPALCRRAPPEKEVRTPKEAVPLEKEAWLLLPPRLREGRGSPGARTHAAPGVTCPLLPGGPRSPCRRLAPGRLAETGSPCSVPRRPAAAGPARQGESRAQLPGCRMLNQSN